jgi:pilus assembly protein CpaD
MTYNPKTPRTIRFAALMLSLAPLIMLAGCSQDFASVDDVYVPRTAEARFPIRAVEQPVKMTVSSSTGKLSGDDVSRLRNFANAAQGYGTTPVGISYPAGSRKAAALSKQAVGILKHQGVSPSRIHVVSYKGQSDVVSLSFTRTTASIGKQCGDWSENAAQNANNEVYPDFGCSYQNNMAAMAANPQDFERQRKPTPNYAASRMPGIETYQSGQWTQPPATTEIGSIGGSSGQ